MNKKLLLSLLTLTMIFGSSRLMPGPDKKPFQKTKSLNQRRTARTPASSAAPEFAAYPPSPRSSATGSLPPSPTDSLASSGSSQTAAFPIPASDLSRYRAYQNANPAQQRMMELHQQAVADPSLPFMTQGNPRLFMLEAQKRLATGISSDEVEKLESQIKKPIEAQVAQEMETQLAATKEQIVALKDRRTGASDPEELATLEHLAQAEQTLESMKQEQKNRIDQYNRQLAAYFDDETLRGFSSEDLSAAVTHTSRGTFIPGGTDSTQLEAKLKELEREIARKTKQNVPTRGFIIDRRTGESVPAAQPPQKRARFYTPSPSTPPKRQSSIVVEEYEEPEQHPTGSPKWQLGPAISVP